MVTPAWLTMTGFKSISPIESEKAIASAEKLVISSTSAARFTAACPLTPASNLNNLISSSMASACRASTGASRKARSASNSIRMPPQATITIGPYCASFFIPSETSTPDSTIGMTTVRGPMRDSISR